MIIKSHKDIYKQVAEKYNFDPKLVEKIGSFTWKDLNKRVANFENREIYVLKLGILKFRKIKGEKHLNDLRQSIPKIRHNKNLSQDQKIENIGNVIDRIRKIEVLLEEWNNIIQKKKDFKLEQFSRSI